MNNFQLLKKMIRQGLRVERLPEPIADLVWAIQLASNDFEEEGREVLENSDHLLLHHERELYEAMPDSSALKEKYLVKLEAIQAKIDRERAQLDRELMNAERVFTKQIKKANTLAELDETRAEIEGYHWEKFRDTNHAVQHEIAELLAAKYQKLTGEKPAPPEATPPAKLTEKDLRSLGVPTFGGKYPPAIEYKGRRYVRPTFMGVSFVKHWLMQS